MWRGAEARFRVWHTKKKGIKQEACTIRWSKYDGFLCFQFYKNVKIFRVPYKNETEP